MRFAVLAAAASLVVATPAFAEDFAGPYVGAGATLDNVQLDGDEEGLGASGIGGTIFAGYDFAIGSSAFAGIEANADLYSADIDAADLNADWSWGISARGGLKINDSTGVYARLGYARGRVDLAGDKSWGDAVRYGAGIQTGVTDQISVRAEFSQFNYEDNFINNQFQLGVSYGF